MGEQEQAGLANVTFSSSAKYTFLYEIGRGGMGIVHLAERNAEEVLDYVVLKTIKTLSPERVARLRSEANIATLLKHENIVKTYGLESIPFKALPKSFQAELRSLSHAYRDADSVRVAARANPLEERHELASAKAEAPLEILETTPTPDDLTSPQPTAEGEKLYVMVMDYVEGTDLNKLQRDHLRYGLLVPVVLGGFAVSRICRALGYAHKYIVHRDVSPENILINGQGVCKLSDFGISVAADEATEGMAGKFEYMAPEQLMSKPADARSDIYSLGLVAYYIATGINLHLSSTARTYAERLAFAKEQAAGPVSPPSEVRPDIPQIYSDIIMRMLEPDPDKRYQDISEAARDLEKTYLYASGFGPTNNSMEAYLQIFEDKFKNPTREQLQQLTFLAQEDGRIHLRQRVRLDTYGQAGLEIIKKRPRSWLYKLLFAQRTGGTN